MPQGFDLLFGLGLQAFPIDKAIIERGVARTLDHLTGELGLFVQHPHGDIDALLDPLGLRLHQLGRAEAVPDMTAVLLQAGPRDGPERTATLRAAECYRAFQFLRRHWDGHSLA